MASAASTTAVVENDEAGGASASSSIIIGFKANLCLDVLSSQDDAAKAVREIWDTPLPSGWRVQYCRRTQQQDKGTEEIKVVFSIRRGLSVSAFLPSLASSVSRRHTKTVSLRRGAQREVHLAIEKQIGNLLAPRFEFIRREKRYDDDIGEVEESDDEGDGGRREPAIRKGTKGKERRADDRLQPKVQAVWTSFEVSAPLWDNEDEDDGGGGNARHPRKQQGGRGKRQGGRGAKNARGSAVRDVITSSGSSSSSSEDEEEDDASRRKKRRTIAVAGGSLFFSLSGQSIVQTQAQKKRRKAQGDTSQGEEGGATKLNLWASLSMDLWVQILGSVQSPTHFIVISITNRGLNEMIWHNHQLMRTFYSRYFFGNRLAAATVNHEELMGRRGLMDRAIIQGGSYVPSTIWKTYGVLGREVPAFNAYVHRLCVVYYAPW